MEFMFWGCFTYDRKGPCYIWKPETAKEKIEAEKKIKELNEEMEESCRLAWEVEISLRRLDILRNKPGRKPKWRFTKDTGKLVREGDGGIDWWRYNKV